MTDAPWSNGALTATHRSRQPVATVSETLPFGVDPSRAAIDNFAHDAMDPVRVIYLDGGMRG